ncbi:MAG: Heparinase family protein [Mucilaginibacter sp.]|nr:Heparinase family protein [Mucilaginibacter sp.]
MKKAVKLLRVCFYTATLLLFYVAGKAQITHRDLLEKYLLPASGGNLIAQKDFKPFPNSPEEWRKKLPDSTFKAIIKNGELALKKQFQPIPATVMLEYVRTGNRVNYERLSFVKRNMLWDLVLAEAAEGKGRFIDHIIDGIWSTCEETYWGLPVHLTLQKAGVGLADVQDPTVDLFSSETASILAWTDYFVGAKLQKVSPLLRPRIYYEVNRRIFMPMDTARYAWMGDGNPNAKLNNWAPWIASNYLTAALLLEKNTAKRADAVNRCIKITDQYINGLGTDGGCDEGPIYWFAAGASVFDILNLLDDATAGKINIYAHPFVKKIGAYIYKTHIGGDYFINVADAHPQIQVDGPMIYRFGKLVNDEQMMRFGSWATYNLPLSETEVETFRRTRRLYNLFAAEPVKKFNEPYHDQTDVWFDDVQLMSSRSINGLFVAAHGGNNGESHNHNDVGDFIVYADNYPVIIDIGTGTYTARTFGKDRYTLWFNTSAYHNLPVINGDEQKEGITYAASAVKYVTDKNHSSLGMNIKNSYPANTGISYWNRNVDMIKSGKIQVTDSYQLSGPAKSITQTFMTVCPADISHPGKILFAIPDQKTVTLDYDAKIWTIKKEKMPLDSPEDQGLKTSWAHKDIYRILLTNKTPTAKTTVNYVIYK